MAAMLCSAAASAPRKDLRILSPSCGLTFSKNPKYLPYLWFAPRVFREIMARQIYKSSALLSFYGSAYPQQKNRVVLAKKLTVFLSAR